MIRMSWTKDWDTIHDYCDVIVKKVQRNGRTIIQSSLISCIDSCDLFIFYQPISTVSTFVNLFELVLLLIAWKVDTLTRVCSKKNTVGPRTTIEMVATFSTLINFFNCCCCYDFSKVQGDRFQSR
jgi:hypothetical protein